MLKPVKMQKVRIVALKSVLEELIKNLHEFGLMEIRIAHYEGLESGRPLDYFNTVSEQLVRIRAIKNSLSAQKEENLTIENPVEEAKKIKLDEELKALGEDQVKTESDLNRLREEQKLIQRFVGFSDIDFSRLETNTITFTLGTIAGGSEKVNSVKERLDKTLKIYNFRSLVVGSDIVILIIHQKSDIVDDILSELGFNRILVPSYVSVPSKSLAIVSNEIHTKENRLERIKHELNSLSKKHYSKIAAIEHALSIESDRAEIASRFNFTAAAAIIEGWVKSDDYQKLEHELAKFDNKAIVEKAHATHDESHPVLLSNPKTASPIQFITEDFSLPGYSEIDPTMIYLFTIPLLYGMIVGDVLYGILSIFIAKFMMKKFASSYILSNVSKIWFYSAFPSILFGIVFDEWAGFSHFHLLEKLEKWGVIDLASFGINAPFYDFHLSRAHNLPTIIGLTVVVGLLHLAFGFILGAINEWHHSKKHALAKIAWLGVELGGVLTVTAYLFNMFDPTIGLAGVIILVVSVIVLGLTEGIVGILELPGFAGNVLSYSRIAAIGVVGVILAEIINEFLLPLPEHGILAFILFPLFIIMHAVNAFIAMFESLIQGGRLNIIEFQSKFLKGGGKPFEPFAVHV